MPDTVTLTISTGISGEATAIRSPSFFILTWSAIDPSTDLIFHFSGGPQ